MYIKQNKIIQLEPRNNIELYNIQDNIFFRQNFSKIYPKRIKLQHFKFFLGGAYPQTP